MLTTGHLGDGQGTIHHFSGGLLLKFRSVVFPPRQFPPSFPARILLDPLSGKSGAAQPNPGALSPAVLA